MLILNLIRHFISRLYKKICLKYYTHLNKIRFSVHGIKYGKGLKVYNKIYIEKHFKAQMTIGNNFILSSGDSINPLCRNIRASLFLERPSSVIVIGNDTGMSSPCIWAKESITFGNRVKVGGDCIFIDSDAHSLNYRIRSSNEWIGNTPKDVLMAKTAPIIIEDDVLIGTRCIILKGVTIGARSIIAAGSVVTKSIPSDCIAGGNPCKVLRNLNNEI